MTPKRFLELRNKHHNSASWHKGWPKEVNECLDEIERLLAIIEDARAMAAKMEILIKNIAKHGPPG